MTKEQIEQAAKEFQADENRPKMGPANSFIQGANFRQAEIDELKKEIAELEEYKFRYESCSK